MMNWRVVSSGPNPNLHLQLPDAAQSALPTMRSNGNAWPISLKQMAMSITPVYDRYRLALGATFTGPAIVEERESTVVVGPGAQLSRSMRSDNLIVVAN